MQKSEGGMCKFGPFVLFACLALWGQNLDFLSAEFNWGRTSFLACDKVGMKLALLRGSF